jgi:hypothetical protein
MPIFLFHTNESSFYYNSNLPVALPDEFDNLLSKLLLTCEITASRKENVFRFTELRLQFPKLI